jgi:hypothetical protein
MLTESFLLGLPSETPDKHLGESGVAELLAHAIRIRTRPLIFFFGREKERKRGVQVRESRREGIYVILFF